MSACHVLFIIALTNEDQRGRQAHVNLVDLVDSPRTGAPVKVFPNLQKLRDHTINNGKYFPKKDAYAGGLLRFLLRMSTNNKVGRICQARWHATVEPP